MTILVAQVDQRDAAIPPWVCDLESFRRWACSEEFPESGRFAHLDGNLWVDTSMETLWHNKLKSKIVGVLTMQVEPKDVGEVFGDRMLLTHVEAHLSTEPDGMYVSHDSIDAGRVRLQRGADSLEVLGTPDMVLEVVSPTSRRKDRVVLRELYHRAGIREYWLTEDLGGQIAFEVLVWEPSGYVLAPSRDGWTQSPVFRHWFRITVARNRSGNPIYNLEVRDELPPT